MSSHPTLDDWISKDAIRFTLESPASIDAGVDKVMGSLGDVELLALGEALHGSDEILVLRNRVFQRLVLKHGYRAAVIEVTSPQARSMNDYVLPTRQCRVGSGLPIPTCLPDAYGFPRLLPPGVAGRGLDQVPIRAHRG